MAAYLSGRISASDRAVLESHLAECRVCRQQVISARRVLAKQHARRPLLWAVPAAAAAILALVVLAVRPGIRVPEREQLRGPAQSADPEGASTLRVISPASSDTVNRAGVVFVWHGHPGRPLFHLTLADGSGRELWSGDTRDTTLTLPTSVSLDPGRTYFWYVDGLGADGRSLTTRTQRFLTTP